MTTIPTAPLTLALPVLAYMRATGSEWSGFGSCRAGDVDSFAVVRLSEAQSALTAQAATIAQLEARLREAEADVRRLDFMCSAAPLRFIEGSFDLWRVYQDEAPAEACANKWRSIVSLYYPTPREAIDAAIAAHGKDEA